MLFTTRQTLFWRLLVLALLIVSMTGPWMFDLISVPAKYACDKPFVRLYGDFCGYPMSGFETVKWAASGIFYMVNELAQMNFAGRSSELLFLTGLFVILLPFLRSLLLVGKPTSHRLQIIDVIVWGLACVPTLTMFIFQSSRGQFAQFFYLLWGLGLYILLAISTMLDEILRLRSEIKPGMAT